MQFSLKHIFSLVVLDALAANAWMLHSSVLSHDDKRNDLESHNVWYKRDGNTLTDLHRAIEFLSVRHQRQERLFEVLAPVYDKVANQIVVGPKEGCLSILQRPNYSDHQSKKFSIFVPPDKPLQTGVKPRSICLICSPGFICLRSSIATQKMM